MQNNSQKRGLALGAVFALVASILGAAPASATTPVNGANIALTPLAGSVSNFNGTILEDFPLTAYLLPGVTNTDFASGKVRFEVTKTSGNVDILVGSYSSEVVADLATPASASGTASISGYIPANQSTASYFTPLHLNSTASAQIVLRAYTASGMVTLSAQTAVVSVKVFIENSATNNGVHDSLEWFTTQTVTLHAISAIPVSSGSISTMNAGDTVVTASATVGTLNFQNLSGEFFLRLVSVGNVFRASDQTVTVSPALNGNTMVSRSGVVSSSFLVTGSAGVAIAESISGRAMYYLASGNYPLGSSFSMVVANPGVTTLSVSATANANITGGGQSYTVRPNQTYTIRVTAATNSTSVSTDVTVTLGGSAGLVTSSRMISVNGGAFLTAYPIVTVKTGTNGVGTFTIATTGFEDTNTITINAKVAGVSASQVTLTTATPAYTVVADNSLVATTPGTAVNLGFSVEDQWGELSTATNQYLKVTRGGSGFNYATTVSYHAVAAGVATVAFTPAPAATTGSATVVADITKLENGAYLANGTSTSVTITVTSTANSFTTGLASSRAASVSYFPSTISWVTVTGKVAVTGSAVTITGDSTLVFRGATAATSSGTVTVYSDANAQYSFEVAALRSGNKTITLTNGTATTTSLIVVADAASDMGRTIAWDTTTIEAGKTRVITGTLTDANGNPVDTTGVGRTAGDSGTASIVVTYTGTAGILVGTMPTETDADGKFKVSVLTAAADSGTLTITAVYMPQGASTVTANKVTSVQAVTVAPAAAPEVNAVIGSFNGRWAVRVENAKGSVVSVKAGNRWVKFSALNNNYLFSRKSVVGRTIAVSVWVDGELQNSQTITIK
jgi:hypothetical protein